MAKFSRITAVPLLVWAILYFFSPEARAQNGVVTFYSAGPKKVTLKVDGNEKVVSLKQYQFVILKIPARQHIFSAWNDAVQAMLPMTIESGKHYYVRLKAWRENKLGPMVQINRVSIDPSTCDSAKSEAKSRIDTEKVNKVYRSQVVIDQENCPASTRTSAN